MNSSKQFKENSIELIMNKHGGLFLGSQNSKVPTSGQISIGRWRGYSWVVKTQSANFWPNFNWKGEGGYSWAVKTQSANFWRGGRGRGGGEGVGGRGRGRGGRDSWVVQTSGHISIFRGGGGNLGKMSKNFAMPHSGSPCIADSLSYTTCVETNK